jgi:hypothetical protein
MKGVEVLSDWGFRALWLRHVPELKPWKPRSDECDTCYRYANGLKEGTDEELRVWLALHLQKAEANRSLYDIWRHSPEPHLCFDFAQQYRLPQLGAVQPGEYYYLSPMKVAVFGVVLTGSVGIPSHRSFYIVPEHVSTQNANVVVSCLHQRINAMVWEDPSNKVLRLHADNCGGQNKNKTVLWFLIEMVLRGVIDRVDLAFVAVSGGTGVVLTRISFLLQGHSFFAPDQSFAAMRSQTRGRDVNSPDQLATLVNQLSNADVKVMEQADVLDWRDRYDGLPSFQGIRGWYRFVVRRSDRGVRDANVQVWTDVSSDPQVFRYTLPDTVDTATLPACTVHRNLSASRIDQLTAVVGKLGRGKTAWYDEALDRRHTGSSEDATYGPDSEDENRYSDDLLSDD